MAICGDYNGGVQFLQACNESETFKHKDIQLKQIEVPFDKPEEYQEEPPPVQAAIQIRGTISM